MLDIEIPFNQDRDWKYRLFEILPGAISWTLLLTPFILSFINVTLAAFFVLAYLLMWLIRSVGVDIRALQGYKVMSQHQRFDWQTMGKDLSSGTVSVSSKTPKWHIRNVDWLQKHPEITPPSELIHAVIVATYNESRELLEPTIQNLLEMDYDIKRQMIFVLAYEQRGGERVKRQSRELVQLYGHHFRYAMVVEHPNNLEGEVIGKGGNVTYAGRALQTYLKEQSIDPKKVIVTTLDSDNRPHKQYFGALSYTYTVCPDPLHTSFQPIVMFTNNIWDAPAPMRVLATGNFFWNIMLQQRQHVLRNFSSHAQGMEALIQTDFWSVRTIVEDGHQFWRSYFRFDGKHQVYPIYLPIYQDAVFASTYVKTLKAQFIQLRRWTYGASDVAYIVNEGFFKKNNISRRDLLIKIFRILEAHITWATAPLLLAFSAFVPLLFHPQSYAANILPITVSRIQTLALIGLLATFFISLKTLPPRPARYTRRRTLFMVLQWAYLPFVSIIYPSLAALNSQTRLMFGRYLDKFDVTEKAVASDVPSEPEAKS